MSFTGSKPGDTIAINNRDMKSTSIWRDTAEAPNYACLQSDAATDAAIIGGGITGITAAYLPGKAGINCMVLEACG